MNFVSLGLRAARQEGWDGERLLADAGICPCDVADPEQFLTAAQIVSLLRGSERENRGGLPLSFAFARNISISDLGMLGVAMVSADDLAGALQVGIQFGKWLMPGLDIRLDRAEGLLTIFLSLGPELAEVAPVMLEAMVLGKRRLDGHFTRPIALRKVCFAHRSGYPPILYEDYLGCPVEFGHATCCVELDASIMRAPSCAANPTTLELATRHLREMQAPPTAQTWSDHVRLRWLSSAKQEVFPSREQIAKGLGVSPKTLSRKLSAERTSYRSLIRETRMELALELIRCSELPTAEIGRRVGFDSEGAFYRAFKHWTARTPCSFRHDPPVDSATPPSGPAARLASA